MLYAETMSADALSSSAARTVSEVIANGIERSLTADRSPMSARMRISSAKTLDGQVNPPLIEALVSIAHGVATELIAQGVSRAVRAAEESLSPASPRRKISDAKALDGKVNSLGAAR